MLLVSLLLAATAAWAQPGVPASPDEAAWPAHGVPPVGTWDLVATGALTVGLLTVELAWSDPSTPRWSSENGFDAAGRRTLRIGSESGRKAAALTSDVLVYALSTFPFINAILVAGIEHERWDVGWRLLVLDAETLLTATLATVTLQHLTARERPFVRACASNPGLADCSVGGKYSSFPSAHTTAVFAAVALECFHHGYLDTSHTGWGAAACPVTIAAATVTGVLRVASDRHWATDVLAGAAVGGAIGYAVPALHLAAANSTATAVLTPALSATSVGLTLAGRF